MARSSGMPLQRAAACLVAASLAAASFAAAAAPQAPRPQQSLASSSHEQEPRRLQTSVRIPPQYFVIANLDNVPDTWSVHELQFFFGHCYQQRRIFASNDMVVSSGTRPENSLDIPEHVVDNIPATSWYAQCKRPMQGCQPLQAWIGIDITYTQEYADASFINASDADMERAMVRCVRFWQSDLPAHRTGRIALQQGVYAAGSIAFSTIMELDDCAGGVWSRRPAWEDTLWRVSNLAMTTTNWAVSELMVFEDVLCQWPARGWGGFSSKPKHPRDTFSEYWAFDGNTSTKWVAGCEYGHCYPREAYLGIDTGETPKTLRCIRMFQYLHKTDGFTPELPSFSGGFELDRWDGTKWVHVQRMWDPKWSTAIPQHLSSTISTPYLGSGPGVWEDARPENKSAWRLTNDDWTFAPWKILELELYSSIDCGSGMMGGEPLSMQGPSGLSQVAYAFDGDVTQDSVAFWQSSCSGYEGRCIPGEAWLGRYKSGAVPDIKCFRLLQSRERLYQSSSVELSMWEGGRWKRHSIHRDVGGGGWNRRPAPPWTMWRVMNLMPIREQWRVTEVRAYSDPYCLFELPRETPISSGFLNIFDDFRRAWDDLGDTSWGADCNPCNQTKEYWVGMQMPRSAETLFNSSGSDFLRCVKIWQSEKFEEQSQQLRAHIWDGNEWIATTYFGDFPGGGGGQWSRHPTSHMTKWRLRPAAMTDMSWRMTELEFYSSVDCSPGTRLPMPMTGQGGAATVLSGWYQELKNYQRIQAMTQFTGDAIWTEGLRGMDGDDTTSTRLVHTPSRNEPAWFGVDFLSETTWVRCVRVQQGNLKPEQAPTLLLEYWSGKTWNSSDPELGRASLRLEGLGGAGYHRRPAAYKTLWRLENLVKVPEGWAIYEAQFHNTETCLSSTIGASSNLPGSPFASGFAPSDLHDNSPKSAFDGRLATAWVSQCSDVPQALRPENVQLPPTGCAPGEAWIGLDIGQQPQQVRCVRILQVGYRPMQSSSVGVSTWDGRAWKRMWRLDGLGGNSWNQRPAMANTMWRLYEHKAKVDKCPSQMKRSFMRSWGVSELGLYADDECTNEITGGVPITSGTVETYIQSSMDTSSYNVENAFDGDVNTVWAANCLLGWRVSHSESVNCEREWLGLDFVGKAVEVRCVKLQQARLESPTCCDMAEDLELQRWNGTKWVEAKWRHEPGPGARETYRWLGAVFKGMGECPMPSYTGSYRDLKMWQKRSRRDSDNCLVPLTSGIPLLAESGCVEHSRCVFAHGAGGQCCPLNGVESRCCCNFLTGENYNEPIFIDEEDTNKVRANLGVEFAIVLISDYLPFIGCALMTVFYIAALALPADALPRVAGWVARNPRCWRKAVVVPLWPFLWWRDLLANSNSVMAMLCCWCVLPDRKLPRPMQVPRFFIFLVVGTLVIGVLPWLGLGLVFGWVFLKVSLLLCIVVRWTKSPYDPHNPYEMRLRQAATQATLRGAEDTAQASNVTFDFVTFAVLGFVYYLKFIFDMLLVRAQMISYGAISPIEAERVVDIFPGMMQVLREPAMLLYWVMYHAGQAVSYLIGFGIGLPRCEGATALVACIALVMVLVTVTQWLNYDFFGLFAAGRQCVKTTRPACQRVLAQGAIMASLSVVFGIIQCAMVLFSRALNMANPFRSQSWMCEWDDFFAIYLGRGLLLLTSIIGCVFVFLCVNGHFMGQDYIVKPVGRMLGLNLDALDPDGTGSQGGVVRCNTACAALPAILGVWIDWWNVDAFLVKERADVYATQLGDPQPCLKCGQIHVNYSNMMCAAGRQIGLACQILPYGILIGKASEYFNDPPIVYCGAALPCYSYRPPPIEPRPLLGKNKCGLRMLLSCADFCTFMIEFGIPIIRRLVAIGMFLTILCGTFLVTEMNLMTLGSKVVLAGFYLSFLKAGGESFFETFLSFCVGLIYKTIHRAEGTLVNQGFVPRTVAGQALVGTAVACVVAVTAPAAGWSSDFWGTGLGCVVGYPASILTLAVNLILEEKIIPGRPRKVSAVRTSSKVLYSLALGLLVGLLGSAALPLRGVIGVVVTITGLTAFTLKLILVDQRPGVDPFDPEFADHGFWDSPTFAALGSLHFLPALVGVPCGAAASGFVGEWLVGGYINVVERIFFSLPFGAIAGVIVALTVNKLLDSYPQLVGSFAGAVTFGCLGLWKPTFAVAIGVFVGAAVGSVLELRVAELRIQAELLKLEQEAQERIKEAELRERKGLEPICDEFTTFEEKAAMESRERRESTMNREARKIAAKERCLADEPISNGVACEMYGEVMVLPDGQMLTMDEANQQWEDKSTLSELMETDIPPLVIHHHSSASDESRVGSKLSLRTIAAAKAEAEAHFAPQTNELSQIMENSMEAEAPLEVTVKPGASEGGLALRDAAAAEAAPAPAQRGSRSASIAQDPNSSQALALYESSSSDPRQADGKQASRRQSQSLSKRSGSTSSSGQRQLAHAATGGSLAGSQSGSARGGSSKLVLVDNFHLERSDDTAEEAEALARQQERAKQRAQYIPSEDDDEKLFGRWDKFDGGSPAPRRGRSEPRRVQRAVPKPSLWTQRTAGPPPAQTPSFREDKRLTGGKPPR